MKPVIQGFSTEFSNSVFSVLVLPRLSPLPNLTNVLLLAAVDIAVERVAE